MEIVPGLHQIKTPMPSPALPYVMAYVLEGKDGISLFDSGYGTPAACEAMTARLQDLGSMRRSKDPERTLVSELFES